MLLVSLAAAQTRTEFLLDEGWKFFRGENDAAYQKAYNDKSWKTVTVPHDWAISGPFDKEIDKQIVAIKQNGETRPSEKTGRTGALPYIGEGWYRNHFQVPGFEKGKRALIVFDGAMSEPIVFLNGKPVGQWNYGYNCFYFDITEHILAGEPNTLAVH